MEPGGGSNLEPPFSFMPPSVTGRFLSVRPSKLGVIGLGVIGGSLALRPSAPAS